MAPSVVQLSQLHEVEHLDIAPATPEKQRIITVDGTKKENEHAGKQTLTRVNKK